MLEKRPTKPFAVASPAAVAILLLSMPISVPHAAPAGDPVHEELDRLRQRIEALEAGSADNAGSGEIDAKETGSNAATGGNREEFVDFGGALRFNYDWQSFDDGSETRRGDIGLDLFRLDVDARRGNFLLSAEYRFYTFMNTIHHGWIGYDFGTRGQVQVGITQVPFGLLPYAAHNYWFGIPYYSGLADDYDAGIKYVLEPGPWNLQLAFFKNAELGDPDDLDRYSYDPVTTGPDRNEQTNTVNGRLAYTLGHGSDCSNELGASGMWGQLYNRDTNDSGSYWAAAAHLDSRCGRWNLQLEGGRYAYHPRNPPGVSDDSITFGAFGAAEEVASAGNFAVVNVAWNLPVRWPGVDLLTCYNDFSALDKDPDGFENSYINTTGCAIGVGPVFTYVDIIRGYNAVYLGNGSLAGAGNEDWETRFNINLGYYW